MDTQNNNLIVKPSLRRAYFFAALYLLVCVQGFYRLQDVGLGDNLPILSIGLLVLILSSAHLKRFFTIYTLTPEYVESRAGIFARAGLRAPLDRITDFAARQTVLQRLLGMADVGINTAGTSNREFMIRNLTRGDAQLVLQRITEFQTRRVAAAVNA